MTTLLIRTRIKLGLFISLSVLAAHVLAAHSFVSSANAQEFKVRFVYELRVSPDMFYIPIARDWPVSRAGETKTIPYPGGGGALGALNRAMRPLDTPSGYTHLRDVDINGIRHAVYGSPDVQIGTVKTSARVTIKIGIKGPYLVPDFDIGTITARGIFEPDVSRGLQRLHTEIAKNKTGIAALKAAYTIDKNPIALDAEELSMLLRRNPIVVEKSLIYSIFGEDHNMAVTIKSRRLIDGRLGE